MLNFLDEITSSDYEIYNQAIKKLDYLIKPVKSLGVLEDIAAKICSIQGTLSPSLGKKVVVVMAADNGVCEEGIASGPQSVTSMQTINFLRGITGIAVISKANNTDIKVIDIGVLNDIYYEGLDIKKIRKGTRNSAKEPAMTMDECLKAINIGFETVKELKDNGYTIIGTGEMGIGNTTTSSSLLVALTNCSIEDATDRGAGLLDDQFLHKKNVIEKIINLHKDYFDNPLECLRRVGGYDIAGMVGLYLGAAYYKIPIVVDGFISIVAALCAYKINKFTKDYMLASHISKEKGYNIALRELNLNPMLNLNMRLGEGVGCPLAFNIIETAISVINNMGTFEDGNIDIKDYKDFWREDK